MIYCSRARNPFISSFYQSNTLDEKRTTGLLASSHLAQKRKSLWWFPRNSLRPMHCLRVSESAQEGQEMITASYRKELLLPILWMTWSDRAAFSLLPAKSQQALSVPKVAIKGKIENIGFLSDLDVLSNLLFDLLYRKKQNRALLSY